MHRLIVLILALVAAFAGSGCTANFHHHEGEGPPPRQITGPYRYGPRWQCRPRLVCGEHGCKQVPGRYCARRYSHRPGKPPARPTRRQYPHGHE